MTALSDALLDFIADLRAAGVRISVAESLDAMRAVAAAGLARSRMREALAAALIKEEADRAVFEEIFGLRFAGRSPSAGQPHRSKGERVGLHGISGGPGDSAIQSAARDRREDDEPPAGAAPARKPPPANRDRPQQSSAKTPAAERPRADSEGDESDRPAETSVSESSAHPSGSEEQKWGTDGEASETETDAPGIEGVRAARMRSIERLPFAIFSEVEFEAAREVLAVLKRRFRIRMSRRLRIVGAGRIDFRRTIRASLQHGGALGDLRFRARRPRHIDLLILADISGSVKYASTLMLEIAAGARSCFRHVRSFVYIDRLAEAGFERGHLVQTPPLDLYARSDFGRVLMELWERRAALITRATVMVIMGDGRNNRRPARADILHDLARLSRAVLWLIPEPQDRWNTGDSAIRQYTRAVTAVVRCENLRELERGLAQVR